MLVSDLVGGFLNPITFDELVPSFFLMNVSDNLLLVSFSTNNNKQLKL
jgi:hypothetical protein